MKNFEQYEMQIDFVKSYFNENQDLRLVSLCTTDGFPVVSVSKHGLAIQSDKLAAAFSTLFSVSNAVATQVLKLDFDTTIIESDSGNIAVISILVDGVDCVLCMAGGASMNVGTLRLHIKRCSKELMDIKPCVSSGFIG